MGIAIFAYMTQGVVVYFVFVRMSGFRVCIFFLLLIPHPAESGVEELISKSCPDAGVPVRDLDWVVLCHSGGAVYLSGALW